MRKIRNSVYSVFLLFGSFGINAQIFSGTGGTIQANSPASNTNVGIGTNNPLSKLEVVGAVKAYAGEFSRELPNGSTFLDWRDRNNYSRVLNLGTVRDPSEGGRLMCFYDFPQSNVINLTKSSFYLSIDDRSNHTRFGVGAETGGNGFLSLMDKNQIDYFKVFDDGSDNFSVVLPKTNSRIIIGGFADYANSLGHKLFVQNGSAKIEGNILTDSNIGIGTSNFTDGSETYRLSVKGKVRAEEVKVYNSWADYVFSPAYKLPNLKEVETYINKNGHLKNVPSAKEITENGLALGEMTKIQQEKIEELTLYLIQQNKEIEELKAQVKLLLKAKLENANYLK